MKRHTANLLILALVLFVAVALLNLLQNLQALPVGGPDTGPVRFNLAPPSLGVNPLLLAWITALAGIGVFLVAFLYYRPRDRRLPLVEFIPLIIGALLLLSILFLLQDLEGLAQEEQEGETGAGEEPANPEEPTPFEFLRRGLEATPRLILVLVSFVAFAAIYFLMATLQARRARALGWSIKRKQELKREMAEALGGRIYSLRLGEDVRSIILGAYRDMVNLFHSHGLLTKKNQTAREVEALALEQLGVGGGASKALRKQFEEARYSFHALTEDHRQLAIESLDRVKRELGA